MDNGAIHNDELPLWSPGPKQKNSNMHKFMAFVNERHKKQFNSYKDLHQWSISDLSNFWSAFFDFAGVKASAMHRKVVDEKAPMDSIPTWFEGCQLNFAENVLRRRGNDIALYGRIEGLEVVHTRTWDQLRQNVACLAAALRKENVRPGDCVVGYLPNCVEAIEAMLAAAAVGAVWSSTSPDFGAPGVLERFSQISPVVLFSTNAVIYNEKVHSHLEKLRQVVEALPSLRRCVVLPFISEASCNLSAIPNSCTFAQFRKTFETAELEFEQLAFSAPLFIMYSSGTTGQPKCMVHSVGGTLLTHMKEHLLHCNFGPQDLLIYYSMTGWMMWNWALSALACGTSVLCFDGSPLRPHNAFMWDLVQHHKVTALGISAKWLVVMEDRQVVPAISHDLTHLRLILSTGSPLRASSFDYVYDKVKADVQLASITGGTDIIGCFAGANPLLPVHRGELQCPLLGMAVESWSEDGKPLLGESGELVCTRPFPSMPTRFWNDKDGSKYHRAYFSKFPGVWSHGDFCQFNPATGGLVMLGRSDGTLNPNGVRFGSAEIYSIVEAFPEIDDSLCVGRLDTLSGEETVILFLKLVQDCELVKVPTAAVVAGISQCPEDLRARVCAKIRQALSARHVPGKVFLTQEFPYTLNGKKVEVAVRQILEGREVKTNRSSLMNPQALDVFFSLKEKLTQ